ncbi:MAG: HNH endonuclease family protein [Pyrinomonadaceae bacterium]
MSKNYKPFLVSNLNFLNTQGKIFLNPKYQREAVWTKSQKQLLIDSILREIDIPKIYFREIRDDAGHLYEVVDGQQRLRAIFEFMSDSFKLPGDNDQVDGHTVAGKAYTSLDIEMSMKLQNSQLDVIVYDKSYSDAEIEETFLRMQNGTPLNAAEKRRAIQGNMRDVVKTLAKDKVFQFCSFTDSRFAYEDAVAKVLHQFLYGSITDIKPTSIAKTYRENPVISVGSREVKRLKQAFSFMCKSFAGTQPALKKYEMVTLPYLVAELLETYDLSKHSKEFAIVYLDFENRRIANKDLPEEKQNPTLSAFTDAARSDSIPDMRYRYDTLKAAIVEGIPSLVLKDPNRSFTDEQRMAIYRKCGGICQHPGCGKKCDEAEFHADHIRAHSRGGRTTVENGQVLCIPHNLAKGDRE